MKERHRQLLIDGRRILSERGLCALISAGLKEFASAIDASAAGRAAGGFWWRNVVAAARTYGFKAAAMTFIVHMARALDPSLEGRRQSGGDRAVEYSLWCSRYDTLSALDRNLIAASVERLSYRPLISILMPVYNPEPRFLRRALDTVVDQLYPNWELCIAEDCSPNPEIRAILAEYVTRDPRIKVVYRERNGHISRASNSALELVTGSFVALMDHDDELPAHALYMVARELNLHPETDVIYTDEDKIDASGRRHDPHFKTDWNEELFYSQNMVAHLGVFRATLVKAVGGFRAGFEGSQDYDFMLRILKLTIAERIRHIPFVLYHWRIFEGVRTFSSNNPSRSVETARQAMDEYFKEVEPDSRVLPIESFPGWWRVKRPLPAVARSVTIVIPTRDRVSLVRNCVEGILTRTDYPDLDVIIIDNGSVEAESLSYFAEVSKDTRVQVLRDDGPFNYSRLNNEAVARARGDYVCFLNNDIEVITPDWLSEMMSHAVRERVGAVGTRLLYAGGTLQHAGVTLGVYGVAAHGHRHFPGNSIGYFGHPQLLREVSAVTGAALLMRKSLFETLGGFDAANLAVSYNDVDLCLRVGEAGYKVIYTPFAALYHLESATRGPDVSPAQKELQRVERGYMQARWGHLLPQDPLYNPNLSLADEDYRLAFPPRVAKPWLDEADVAERLARKGQVELDVEAANTAGLAMLAADTAAVIASAHPFEMLEALGRSLMETDFSLAGVTVVDNTPRSDGFVREGAMARFRAAHPDVPVIVVDDASQDFNGSRTANLGVRASGTASHLLIVTEDCGFVTGWLTSLLSSWQAAGGGDVVITPRIFVRENTARDGVLTDGFVEAPLAQVAADPAAIAPMGASYDGLPLAGRIPPSEVETRPALEETTLLEGGIVFGRRALLVDEPGDRTDGFESHGAVFDTLFLTQAARLEDMARRLLAAGARLYAATAPLIVLSGPRPRDMVHLWQYWHDYLWLNRKVHGLPDDGRIEFVCPFHRGDVLIGLQVAHTAVKAGKAVRFHVAESLLGWVRDFSPSFPVEGLPVPVPPAQETALYLLRSYEHVLRRGDAGPRLVRSHPFRGLDAMDNNLATAMLAAVGLPPETLIESLEPEPDASQEREAAALLAAYGERVVLLHRSGGWGLKTIPDAVMEELATIIKAEGFHLVQIGGPGDTPCREADGLIAQNLSAGHWAALFSRASAIVGVDSWSAHMAAILDVPQVTLYGSTHPRHVASKPFFRRKSAEALMLGPVLPCSPCNSLKCLIEPIPYCKGYSIDQTKLKKFLEKL
ncbi:hypothetical protein B0E45_29765 [Sinorhizobium sp. A49]|uniref:glycosyltransferase n=1 Tax=Sinorhizobium sp. A49 TaxID=1945861 RepID=UPI0009D1B7B5|nr:glycosyltransferase [Sinorhizobium sp. A49]OOG63084.1 hypothetical protein B0E45_29765 [Sinorhizobium sp. A49]